MTPALSSKMAAVSALGFSLRHSRQASYAHDWHLHDCAMLLWPQIGGLHSAWSDTGRVACTHQIRLARSNAILLPPMMAHRTRSDSARQQHGELYLSRELLRGCDLHGALQLDGATVAMLDALLAPALHPASAAPLVRAIVAQLLGARPVTLAPERPSVAHAMLRSFACALQWERPMPTIEATADALGVSMRQLQRACRQAFDSSPVRLRQRVLAAHARALLADGRTLPEVSLQLGFSNSGHLTRLMRTSLDD